jgi:hypothetical protein
MVLKRRSSMVLHAFVSFSAASELVLFPNRFGCGLPLWVGNRKHASLRLRSYFKPTWPLYCWMAP